MTVAHQTDETRAQPLAAGLAAFLALCAGTGIAIWYVADETSAFAHAVALLFFALTGPFLVLAHEFGHLSSARLLGWRVPLLTWGGITLRLSPLRVTAGAPAFGQTAAGAVVAVPPQGRGSAAGWAFVSAGGPLVNLLLGFAALWAAFAAETWSVASDLYAVFAAISLAGGLFNLWPFTSGSDGSHILAVLFAGLAPWRSLYARLAEQGINGVRPRDWPLGLIEEAQRVCVWEGDTECRLSLYAWHLDRGELAPARAQLDRAPRDERVLIERAFLAAWFDGDASTGRHLLSQTLSWSAHARLCYWRASAALAVAEGNAPAAREAVRKGRLLCETSPYATAFDREWFDAVERRLGDIQ